MQGEPAAKPNTPCRYFYRSGSCRRGDQCKFSHDVQRREGAPSVLKRAKAAPKAETRLNPASAEFKPRQPSMVTTILTSTLDTDADANNSKYEPCGICTDIPSPFAQLLNCNHYFCVDCLKNWRSQGTGKGKKCCPTCRAESDYIYVVSEPQRDSARLLAIQRHKDRLKQIPCKHFAKTSKPRPPNSRKIGRRKDEPAQPFCIFGEDCLYSHKLSGKEYVFDQSFESMKATRQADRDLRRLNRNDERNSRQAESHADYIRRHRRRPVGVAPEALEFLGM